MDKMFCVRCKKRTANGGAVKTRTTKNGRKQAYTKCSVCDTKKCQFVKG